jgi:SNF2 family DNA or RNA helicase
LALIVARPSEDQKNKTTLIIAPVALLKQWEREIDKKLKKGHKLSVCVFHGAAKKAKSYKDLASFDGEKRSLAFRFAVFDRE